MTRPIDTRAAAAAVPDDLPLLSAMLRAWWVMAARGGLAVLFGLSVLVWPHVTLALIVALFGVYAVLDGVLAIVASTRASGRLFAAWPVALEGLDLTACDDGALTAPRRTR